MAYNNNEERFEGTWNGISVHPKRTFMGYRFTDEECDALLRGEKVRITGVTSKNGKKFDATVDLGHREYNGHEYIGVGFVDGVPTGWGGHTFTEDERLLLEAGKTVELTDCVSKSTGRTYSVPVSWEDVDGRKRIVPHFSR